FVNRPVFSSCIDKIVPGVLLEILDVWTLLLFGNTGEAITHVEVKPRQLRTNFKMGCLIFITGTIFFIISFLMYQLYLAF
ncbi:hypothetical protein, partial [Acinetobacter soli]|uniref:hypothetical protein n=1 Tax=Acinetobacter soli TaxID=487316 RepID=UPI0032B58FFF